LFPARQGPTSASAEQAQEEDHDQEQETEAGSREAGAGTLPERFDLTNLNLGNKLANLGIHEDPTYLNLSLHLKIKLRLLFEGANYVMMLTVPQ